MVKIRNSLFISAAASYYMHSEKTLGAQQGGGTMVWTLSLLPWLKDF